VSWQDRLRRLAPPLLVGVLPAALLSIGVARFILNHFLFRAPYLLDSGWYSAIVYRAGLFPRNPPIACDYAEWYYGVHVSPFVSAFSALSYLAPLRRIEWYAFFQAVVFFPFGIATYVVASKLAPSCALRRLPITVVAALAFAFSGLVLWMVGYPHYEPAIPGLICLVLGAVLTGRTRLAWVVLGIAVCVREDAGLHTALALSPVLYLHWRGVEMLPSRRTLVKMIAVAIAASVVAIACQKLFCHPVSLLRAEYLGDPLYAHLSLDLLARRGQVFLEHCQRIYYPFVATAIMAAWRRDARYLLGWAAATPWFLFNFTAAQDAKGAFGAYTVFPFVVSVFWVYAYGALLAPAARRLRPGVLEAVFALVCATSTWGFHRGLPDWFVLDTTDMAISHHRDRAAVHGFVDALDKHHGELGKLYVDEGVAALAIESSGMEVWHPRVAQADAIAFHDSVVADDLVPDLITNSLDVCTHVLGTRLHLCSHAPLPATIFAGLTTETAPSVFAFASLARLGASVRQDGLALPTKSFFALRLGRLPRGTYEMTWTFTEEATELPWIKILAGDEMRASATAAAGSRDLRVQFEATGAELLNLRFFSSASLVISDVHTRHVSP
jgi:hypothetical protein